MVRHRIVDDWSPVEQLVLDEEATAACWAWEQDYIGMEIAGTIHNEIRVDGQFESPEAELGATGTPVPVAQHEPSGGGRSIPQHVRLTARESRAASGRIEQRTAGVLRRTRVRRNRDEIAAAGSLVAAEALEMISAPTTYPTPGSHCLACEFESPCLTMYEGSDPEPVLAAHFHRHSREDHKPRLGQVTWGFGRGAAPPDW